MMGRIYNRFAGVMIALFLVIIMLITAVEAVVYWMPGYFEYEYEKHQVLEDVHMSMDSLMEVTEHMMGYLRGQEEDLQISTTIRGIVHVPFFNERELMHMEDVRNLFLGGLWLRRICMLCAAVGIFLLWRRKHLSTLPKFLFQGMALIVAAVALLVVLISTDFNRYFIIFHHIFFKNDLWILNPLTDRLINIVPQPFFIDTAAAIAIVFAVEMITVMFIVLYLHKKYIK